MLQHPLLLHIFTSYQKDILKKIQAEMSLEELRGFCKANIIKLDMLPHTAHNFEKLKAYEWALKFYDLYYYYKYNKEETEIMDKIWFIKITEKDIEKYLEKHKDQKSENYCCNDDLCKILEYLLAN